MDTAYGDYLITLGIPFGNGFSEDDFYYSKYYNAKSQLTNVRRLKSLGPLGRVKLANANFLGRFRYYLYSINMSKPIIKAIESDLRSFINRKDPEQDANEVGSTSRTRPLTGRKSAHLSFNKGGYSLINWTNHVIAFQASWLLRYIAPREADWKLIIDHWIGGRENRQTTILLPPL